MDLLQAVDFVNNEATDAEVAEDALDKLTMMLQQHDASIGRSFVLADSDVSGASTLIPTPAASKLIGWNSAGTGLANYAAATIIGTIVPSAFMETVLDDTSAAVARTTLDVPSNAEAILDTLLTTTGDMIQASAASTPTRLAAGTAGYVLTAGGAGVASAWAASGFTTGDVKLTLKTTADTGWVLMNDTTIGNGASGASGRANADTEALFLLLWTNTADAQCAVSSGRGASAAADYAANKTIALPKALGRALATYGAGSGLTSRVLALTTGVETHPLITAELASHSHTIDTVYSSDSGAVQFTSGSPNYATSVTKTSNTTGSGTAHQNMQPTLFLNTMIKL
jgi:hypothetical protein